VSLSHNGSRKGGAVKDRISPSGHAPRAHPRSRVIRPAALRLDWTPALAPPAWLQALARKGWLPCPSPEPGTNGPRSASADASRCFEWDGTRVQNRF